MNDPAAKAEMIRIRLRSSRRMRFLFVVLLAITSGLYAQSASKTGESRNERSLKAAHVFDLSQPIIFSDDFSSWKTRKIIYVTDFKMGSERARYEDIESARVK